MSRPLKLKVSGTVLCSVFQLPDHGFIGQFAGAHRRRFSLNELDGPPLISGQIQAKLDLSAMRRESPLFAEARGILFRYAVTRAATRA